MNIQCAAENIFVFLSAVTFVKRHQPMLLKSLFFALPLCQRQSMNGILFFFFLLHWRAPLCKRD